MDDSYTGDYYTLNLKKSFNTWLHKTLGLFEDVASVYVSATTSADSLLEVSNASITESSLLEISNASINSENSDTHTHTLSG